MLVNTFNHLSGLTAYLRMASKKISDSKQQEGANALPEIARQEESQKEMLLQLEYDTLTEELRTLKRRVEQLRKENEFLQNEVAQTHVESEDYISFLAKRAEKRQIAIGIMNDQSHQELADLQNQRKNMQDNHEEQASELQKEILDLENELAKLNIEIADLEDVKTLQQQQSCRLAELDRELNAMQCHHTESLLALRADLLREKKKCEQQAKEKVRAMTANKMASLNVTLQAKEVFQENRSLLKELENLLQRFRALQKQQDSLQTHQWQLLQEREYVEKHHAQRVAQFSKKTIQVGLNDPEHPPKQQQ